MRLFVIKPIRLKKAGKIFDVSPGGIVEIKDPLKAQGLINSGHVRPLLPDEAGKPVAARIYSKILADEIWVIASPEAATYVPAGAVTYLPDEIRNLRGASEDEIRQIHMIKKEFCGRLIATKDKDRNL